jgi:D-serine deaminase-like pyridoxal phosphate-dependent protein
VIEETRHITLRGVVGYEGHLLTTWPLDEKVIRVGEAVGRLTVVAADLRQAGHAIGIVSCGGTGSYEISASVAGVTEIQAGGGCLMDAFYSGPCHVTGLDFALVLRATVVSRPTPERAIVDAGFKSMGRAVMPIVLGEVDTEMVTLSAEHGTMRVPPDSALAVGQVVELIPGYGDDTILLHRQAVVRRAGTPDRVLDLDHGFRSR